MNIGSTGRYVDGNENEYAAQVVGRTFTIENGQKVENGNFEVIGTFRDGTTKLFSNIPAASITDPNA
ncbi:MAG TPA: hypothetical protein VIF11_15840 [Methylomirabilota bacterium]|jgi:hypothetical protein